MPATPLTHLPTREEAARWTAEQVVDLARERLALGCRFDAMKLEVEAMKHQLDWFRRQLFGQKSEKRLVDAHPHQMNLGELPVPDSSPPPPPAQDIAAHTRRARTTDYAAGDESAPFFDEARVPVETIAVPNPDADGLTADQYEVIGEKTSFRLAQRPGSYVILKYVRPVIKRRDTQVISCPAAPRGVIEGSRADVSFIAGMLIDKFAYHLPFYRQHQRLGDTGITVSRPWLTQLGQHAIALIEPIFEAQFGSIRASRVKAMDETPIKAGRAGPGKLKAAYFWPVYGELDEVCFPFFESRRIEHVEQALGLTPVERGVLLSDGYTAYEHYTKKTGLTHAQCWAHTRRHLFEAKDAAPQVAAQALEFIGGLYAVEAHIREKKLSAAKKLDYRLMHAKPIVERFFAWVSQQFEAQGLLPSNPMTKALAYARERRFGLEVYLTDPDVPIDTNPLERALRAIPMGRRNWLFCWTELGARQVGIMQSLIVTCRLHDIDPYDYLVDVLQRVSQHPASRVHELTPRLWKQLFAGNPLRSPLHSPRP
uniref:IS66 family transposase n=2 Tax=Aromatoleum TaxID=551759 RepID=A0ABX1PTI3_9RHOO